VTVNYLDRDGRSRRSMEADGMLATCVQHEIDHLNGVLFIDHISKLKRDMVIKKFTKLARQRGTTRL
jgi:peptide deformylase